MRTLHHTLIDFGISLLLPLGYYPTLDEDELAFIEKKVDFEDQAPDNPELLMSVHRWRTNDAINLSAEMCAHFHLYELEDAHQWIFPAQPLTSDGQVGAIQNFECHSGEGGFVATFDLINDIERRVPHRCMACLRKENPFCMCGRNGSFLTCGCRQCAICIAKNYRHGY